MTKNTIISVCGDPGGARALVPVLKLLSEHEQVLLINYAYNEGLGILSREGLNPIELLSSNQKSEINQILQNNKTKLLLTSTSHNTFNWEKYFIECARTLKIFSLAILDFWSNYTLRFSDHNGNLIYLPDMIAVMDERAKNEMITEGIPASKICITGQPAFDSLLSSKKLFSIDKRRAFRDNLQIPQKNQLITFVSQPFSKMYTDSSLNNPFGFDEKEVLKNVISAIETFEDRKNIVLLIRPHPREKIEDYINYHSSKIKILVSSDGDSRESLMASDLILGMNSVSLMEACYLGCIVVSLQPKLKIVDPLPTNAWGMSLPVYHLEDFPTAIRAALFNEDLRKSILRKNEEQKLLVNSAKRIVDYTNLQLNNRVQVLP